MSTPISLAQIGGFKTAFVGVGSFATAGGNSDTVTSAVTSALSTASASGGALPVVAGTTTSEGIDTATGFNFVKVYLTATGKNYVDGSGNDVYGKITVSGTTVTLAYFSRIAGTETAFAMPANTVDFAFPYVFSTADFPFRGSTILNEAHVGPDLAPGYMFRLMADVLTVATANAVPNLSQNFVAGLAFILYNGVAYPVNDPAPVFTLTAGAKTVTFTAANAPFGSLPVGAVLFPIYTY